MQQERWVREGKEEDSVGVCVCVRILQRDFCVVSGWVRQSVGPGSLQCSQPFSSRLSGNIMCLWDAQRNSPVSPDWAQIRQLKTEWGRKKVQHGLELKLPLEKRNQKGIFEDSFLPFGITTLRSGYAMLAQRNGLPIGCKPVPLKDHPDLRDVDVNAEGCCSLSPSSSSGGCPWARLAGVDGCLSEPYCLWFQLLARAYWGEVELGLTSPNRSVSWARLREASRKNCVRSRVRAVGCEKDGEHPCEWTFWGGLGGSWATV